MLSHTLPSSSPLPFDCVALLLSDFHSKCRPSVFPSLSSRVFWYVHKTGTPLGLRHAKLELRRERARYAKMQLQPAASVERWFIRSNRGCLLDIDCDRQDEVFNLSADLTARSYSAKKNSSAIYLWVRYQSSQTFELYPVLNYIFHWALENRSPCIR